MTDSMITSVDRIDRFDHEDFHRSHVRRSRPAVLTTAMADWPALGAWSLDRLQSSFGTRTVTVGETRGGRLVLDRTRGIPQRETTLGAFIDELRGGDPGWYLLTPVEQRVPELLEDLRLDALAPRASWRSQRLWIGASDTASALHHDLPENFLAQVAGRKRVTLIHRRHARDVYRNGPLHGAPNFCAVDAEDPDYDRHPRFRRVAPITLELAAGEILYIPRLWWHQVRTLDLSISVNHWFASGLLALAARTAQRLARLRGLR